MVESIEKNVDEICEIIEKTLGNGDVSRVTTSSPLKFPTSQSKQERRLSQTIESLQEEISTLKESNTNMMEALEIKERKINELLIILRETKLKLNEGGDEK